MTENGSLALTGKNRYFRSWYLCAPGFEEPLKRLRSGSVPEDEHHHLINVSSGKYVYRCQDGEFDFAYKTQQGKTFWRYMFRPSLPLREYRNYAALQQLGIPIPRILAVGDTRCCFVMSESFIITGFLDNTVDGRCFMPEGRLRSGSEELCRAFSAKNMQLLAKLHDGGLFHKAAHARNFLFRGDSPENMEVFWIDVARMRKAKDLRRCAVWDLHTFFRDMQLKRPMVEELVKLYLESAHHNIFSSVDEVVNELVNFKRRWFSKRKYRIFDGE